MTSYAGVEAVLYRRSKFLRRGARHGLAYGSRFRKMGRTTRCSRGKWRGPGVPIGKENASDKGTVQTGGAPGLHAGPPLGPGTSRTWSLTRSGWWVRTGHR